MTQAKFNCGKCGRLLVAPVPAASGHIACPCGSVEPVPWSSLPLNLKPASDLLSSSDASADDLGEILRSLHTHVAACHKIAREFRALLIGLMLCGLAALLVEVLLLSTF
jgi:hypothetical protein